MANDGGARWVVVVIVVVSLVVMERGGERQREAAVWAWEGAYDLCVCQGEM